MGKDINFDILGRKLMKYHPYIAHKLIENPILYDLNRIPDLWEYFKLNYDWKDSLNLKVFIASIVKLYDPDGLAGYKQLRTGLRKKLSETLEIYPTQISHYLATCRDYIKVYADFSTRIDTLSKELVD